VRARDSINGQEFDIRARLVLNAAGPWAEYLLEGQSDFGSWKRGYFSRDACFVVDRKPRSKYAIAVQGQTRDRDAILSREARHMFVVPWRDYTLIGVWHKLFEQTPDTAIVEEEELTTWLAEMTASFPELGLQRKEIVYTNRGLVPFGDGQGKPTDLSFGKESRFLDHRKMHGVEGLVTVIGIRYTTARGDAGKALDMLLTQLPNAPANRQSAHEPLAGGNIADFADFARSAESKRNGISPASFAALLRNHGTEYVKVLDQAPRPIDRACVDGTDTLLAEVDFSVREEQANTLEDVVMRRTNMGSGSHPGERAIESCAARMQDLSAWSDERRRKELEMTRNSLARHHAAVRNQS
jgi:glycerol-3-phosphate dehydrogenase